MKKIFLVSSLSLLTMSPMLSNFINYSAYNTKLIIQAVPIEQEISNIGVEDIAENLDLRTEPINLTALGIKGNNGLHEYTKIELSGFSVTFKVGMTNTFITEGKAWGAKMSEGEGDYATVFNSDLPGNGPLGAFGVIERKHSLWYDANGNYKLALVYRINCFTKDGNLVFYLPIKAQIGSIIKFS